MDENEVPKGKNPKESSDELLDMISRYGEKNRAAAKELAKKAAAGAESAAPKPPHIGNEPESAAPEPPHIGNEPESAAAAENPAAEPATVTDAGPGYEADFPERHEAAAPTEAPAEPPAAVSASGEKPAGAKSTKANGAEAETAAGAGGTGTGESADKPAGAGGAKSGGAGADKAAASAHYGDGFDGAVRPVPEGGHLTDGDGNAVSEPSAEEDAFSPEHFAGPDKVRKKARRAYRRAKFRNAKKKSKGSVTVSVVKAIGYIVIVCCLSFFVVFGFFDVWPGLLPIANDLFALREEGDSKVIVDIKEGMTTDEVADLLVEKDIIDEARVFKFYVRYKYDESMGIDKDDLGGSALHLAKEFCKTMFLGDDKADGENSWESSGEESGENSGDKSSEGGVGKSSGKSSGKNGGGKDADGSVDIKYLPGEHTLSANMNYDQILQALTTEEYHREQVTVTVPEGYTTQQIIELLLSEGIGTKDGFVYAVNEYPYKHEFVELLTEQSWKDGRIFRLEGYLYPDTYVFYKDASEVEVINKMLNSFANRVWAEYYTTYKPVCEAEGVTFDEMITLASIVQAEGKTLTDFENVSQVFHSRRDSGLPDFQRLESCATIQYAMDCDNAEKGLKVPRKPVLSGEDLKYDSLYNTYIYEGLPPGAICNPGLDAIEAALYPDLSPQVKEEFGITTAYYFNSDITGKIYYAQTPYQHGINKSRAEKKNAEIEAGGGQN